MPDEHHQNLQQLVANLIDDPVAADADPPKILDAGELDGPGRSRVVCQLIDPGGNPHLIASR